jgi:hypothetical protein
VGNRIDYFQQHKAFDYLCLTELGVAGITASQRSVYHALLSINNNSYWSEFFQIDFQYALDLSRVDKDTYRRAMDFLNANGLFDSYVKGVNKYTRAVVSLKPLHEKSVGNTVDNKDSKTVSSGVSDAHFNKTKDIQTVKTINYKNKKVDFNLIFNNNDLLNGDPEMVKIFKIWFDYKAEINQGFKSESSTLSAFKLLKKYSGEKVLIAQEIIDKSIGMQYQGFFPLKNEISKEKAIIGKSAVVLDQYERLKLVS